MLYQFYESLQATAVPVRLGSMLTRQVLEHPANPWRQTLPGKHALSSLKFFEFMSGPKAKPEFGIDSVQVNGKEHEVQNRVHSATPFCELLEFKLADKTTDSQNGPRLPVLLVAPMSGHHASLLRDTVKRLLSDCDVYVTDWLDVRDIPLTDGVFDLDSYIAHVRDFMVELINEKGDLHVVGVCQPGPAVLSAVSLLAQNESEAVPTSMTFMGSPIDPRKSPTVPNRFAEEHTVAWFKRRMITEVPRNFRGAGRSVYPGFLQLIGFVNMNPSIHHSAYMRYYSNLVSNNDEAIDAHEFFYSEYNAVMDMSSDFYLQTIDKVFHQAAIATGEMTFRHHKIDPSAISNTALMTIEGEKDDISGIGQTKAAHDICTGIPKEKRKHIVQPGAGHYGVFSGRRWREHIAPALIQFMREHQSPSGRH